MLARIGTYRLVLCLAKKASVPLVIDISTFFDVPCQDRNTILDVHPRKHSTDQAIQKIFGGSK